MKLREQSWESCPLQRGHDSQDCSLNAIFAPFAERVNFGFASFSQASDLVWFTFSLYNNSYINRQLFTHRAGKCHC